MLIAFRLLEREAARSPALVAPKSTPEAIIESSSVDAIKSAFSMLYVPSDVTFSEIAFATILVMDAAEVGSPSVTKVSVARSRMLATAVLAALYCKAACFWMAVAVVDFAVAIGSKLVTGISSAIPKAVLTCSSVIPADIRVVNGDTTVDPAGAVNTVETFAPVV